MKEIKIVPVDNGYFIKTYEKGSDLRSPLETLVAGSLEDLLNIIRKIYES